MKLNKQQLVDILKVMQINTDNVLDLQRRNMQLESDLFHEKWKFRYVSRRLKELDPNEAITEEELNEQIRSKEN
tara:strand:+ start:284 stop:505 length:222 start_codon:yes stop_codon:yes gene_type:complete